MWSVCREPRSFVKHTGTHKGRNTLSPTCAEGGRKSPGGLFFRYSYFLITILGYTCIKIVIKHRNQTTELSPYQTEYSTITVKNHRDYGHWITGWDQPGPKCPFNSRELKIVRHSLS